MLTNRIENESLSQSDARLNTENTWKIKYISTKCSKSL